ncbi:tumor necrosis factor receptor superfamily member 14-like isoform X1 [Petromyzon marinus]|uniref:Tumor necrosis factor receptor superfamily member 14-like isoform X1 n=1 Tax=Petromyzon marinus TaxID=7757 RepID=A0AAJ7UA97_PETMA|nr:tumor necrosis factor receptor superfamily member 14-like isoform X1 [Petromyzon marinus]
MCTAPATARVFAVIVLGMWLVCAMPESHVEEPMDCCEAWDHGSRGCLLCAAGCYSQGTDAGDAVSCAPCEPGSFTSFPNLLLHCLPCTHCHAERGLVLAQNCTRRVDTVCACEPRSYCAVFTGHHCELCLKNWTCTRGQEMKQGSTQTEAVTQILIGISVFALCVLCITGFFTCKSCLRGLRHGGH